jgi:glutaredoxin 3
MGREGTRVAQSPRMKSEAYPVGIVSRRHAPLLIAEPPNQESFDGRERCHVHGFLLAQGHCPRCASAHSGLRQNRRLARIVACIAAFVLVCIAWRAVAAVREGMDVVRASRARAAQGQAEQTSAPKLVVYTTWFCPYCSRAKSWLDDRDVEYVVKHVDTDQDAFTEFHRIGGSTVPMFVVDGQILQRGFDANDPGLERQLIEKGILTPDTSPNNIR